MHKKNLNLLVILCFISIICFAPAHSTAQGVCSPFDSSGYVFLHPYFEGKNWGKTYETTDIILSDTLCSQRLRPVKFDIGKEIDSTVAVFSTANGDFYVMPSTFISYIDPCVSGEVQFFSPQKVPLAGISFSGATPWYLIKDAAYNYDTVKVVFSTSVQRLMIATIKTKSATVVKIDSLIIQGVKNAVSLWGDYDKNLGRDTCIWVCGANGMIRHFSYKHSSWGGELNKDITTSDSILCVNNQFAGTNTGKIYKGNASLTFTLVNSSANKAINNVYNQGAIGNNGNFIEFANATLRLDTLGSGNYQHANFIKRPGGFGIELLDKSWNYSIFSYRDSSSKVAMTTPGGQSLINKYPGYIYDPVTYPQDSLLVYILDPDNNFKNTNFSLFRSGITVNLKSDGVHSISSISDSITCALGTVRFSDSLSKVRVDLRKDSIGIKIQGEIGTMNITCNTCYWKKYNYSVWQHWSKYDLVTLTAGNDVVRIYNQSSPPVTSNEQSFKDGLLLQTLCKIKGSKLIISLPNYKTKTVLKINIFEFSGKLLASIPVSCQKNIEVPHSFSSRLIGVALVFSDGTSQRLVLPLIR